MSNYDRLSRWYDLFSGSEEPGRRAALELLAARPGERILEIGPGTGRCLAALGESVAPGGLVLGLERSIGMLHQARGRTAGLGAAGLLRGDGRVLPLPCGIFDGILMTFVLELFSEEDIPLVLAECRRVLRPGGRLALTALEKAPGRAVRLYEWFHSRLPELVDCRPIYPAGALQAAGFKIVEARRLKMWGLAVCVLCGEIPC